VETFVSREAIEACIVSDRRELPPSSATFKYVATVDPSGGSADSMTMCIAHAEKRGDVTVSVIDLVREVRPPFSPAEVVGEFADTLKAYGVLKVIGDRYGGEFAREPFHRLGIAYELAEKPKSDLYRDFLPLLNSKRVELLDDRRIVAQLASLERKTSRGSGRDSIDHPIGPSFHDDVANVVASAAVLAVAVPKRRPRAGFGWVTTEEREDQVAD